MKYIIFDDFAAMPTAILFPNRIGHAEMREQIPYAKVISAGYVEAPPGGDIRCRGSAPDLRTHSREDKDAAIIQKQFTETDLDS